MKILMKREKEQVIKRPLIVCFLRLKIDLNVMSQVTHRFSRRMQNKGEKRLRRSASAPNPFRSESLVDQES